MKKFCLLPLAFLPLLLSAQGLEVIASGGLYLSRGGINIQATIGEVCIGSPSGNNAYATEGFQQGYKPLTLMPALATDRSDVAPEIQAQLYPNPAVDRLEVQINASKIQSLRLKMFDARGLLVQETETASERHIFDVSMLAPGSYWVLLESSDQEQPLFLPFSKINH